MDSLAPQDIATQFAEKYYSDFQADRVAFVQLFYREVSNLTFESSTYQGIGPIGQKWTEDFLKNAKLKVTTTDAQRGPPGFVIVLVTGLIQLSENDAPMNFAQSFTLAIDAGGVFCLNDIFKLVYG
ncbi:putative nuclear transport factor 2 [Rosellinia necatrix]|uniref:Nuclear transport factor 2 n=1 Tax=Rosellinia necatrix TaxID=77044 RepID=A0A1W2TS06_ROSNE|nr:putative nuclear transport factor 2 [Rosellinia necatrix]